MTKSAQKRFLKNKQIFLFMEKAEYQNCLIKVSYLTVQIDSRLNNSYQYIRKNTKQKKNALKT